MSSLNLSYRLLRRFGWRIVSDLDFSRGIIRDLPRSSIPPGGVYNSVDYLLDRPGLARKRGGTSYQSNALGANTGGVTMIAAPEYSTGAKVVALAGDGHIYDASTGTSSDRGALGISTIDNPKLYVDTLVIPSSDGTTAPKKLTISGGNVTIGNLGGSPPAGKYAAIHLSRVILANSSANANRIWFSPVPNIESTWDTANAYADTNHALTAIAPIQGVLLCFSSGATERIVGSTPPGTDGEDMSLQPIGQIGCADARSIAVWQGFLVFASQDGIWVTNGSGFDSLIEKSDGSGILAFWRETVYPAAVTGSATIAGGMFSRNYYHLCVSGSGGLVDHWICYMPRKTWQRVSNINALCFATATTGADELYAGLASGSDGNRLVKLSGIYQPAAANKNDANGTAVTPLLETRMLGAGTDLKPFGHAHLTFDMRDAASDNPTMAVTAAMGLGATTFAAVPESPLIETTDEMRKRFSVNKEGQGLTLRFQQANASSKTEIHAIEVEQRMYAAEEEI